MSELKEYIDLLAKFGEVHKFKRDAAQEVKVVQCAEVLTKEQIAYIKTRIRPKKRECYKNALDVARYLNCEYVEGMMQCYIGIDHAFNKVGDKYIDVTKEFALGENPSETVYMAFKSWDAKEAVWLTVNKGTYGELFSFELYELR